MVKTKPTEKKVGGCSKTVYLQTARLIQHIALFTDIRPWQKSARYFKSCAHDCFYIRVSDALNITLFEGAIFSLSLTNQTLFTSNFVRKIKLKRAASFNKSSFIRGELAKLLKNLCTALKSRLKRIKKQDYSYPAPKHNPYTSYWKLIIFIFHYGCPCF